MIGGLTVLGKQGEVDESILGKMSEEIEVLQHMLK
jgi:hypothetical protein